uniref:Uncharacterized protein n=1 Tax=Oryza barthii TaxID=65489 RepID=A0A0D3F8A3_9ORYZ
MPSHPHSRRRSQPRAHRKHIASPIGEARRRQGASEAATCLQAARRRRRLEAPCAAVVDPAGAPYPLRGRGRGKSTPCAGMGRGTSCFLCCGDGYGVHKPDGGSPVAIPREGPDPPVPPYHSHSQIRLFLRTFFCILRFILFRFDLFFHGCFVVLLCKRCDGSDDLICLDCEEVIDA